MSTSNSLSTAKDLPVVTETTRQRALDHATVLLDRLVVFVENSQVESDLVARLRKVLACEAAEPLPLSRADWIAQAKQVYLDAGDDDKLSTELATWLSHQEDWLGDEVGDPAAAAREDLAGRPKPESGNLGLVALHRAFEESGAPGVYRYAIDKAYRSQIEKLERSAAAAVGLVYWHNPENGRVVSDIDARFDKLDTTFWTRIALPVPAAPKADDLITLALAHIRWQSFGECRTAGFDGPPPSAAEAVAALERALAQTGATEQPLPAGLLTFAAWLDTKEFAEASTAIRRSDFTGALRIAFSARLGGPITDEDLAFDAVAQDRGWDLTLKADGRPNDMTAYGARMGWKARAIHSWAYERAQDRGAQLQELLVGQSTTSPALPTWNDFEHVIEPFMLKFGRDADFLKGMRAESHLGYRVMGDYVGALEQSLARWKEVHAATSNGAQDASAASVPLVAGHLSGDAAQAHQQCRAVIHLALSLAAVYEARAMILGAGQGPVDVIGQSSAAAMEWLGDVLSNMDAVEEGDDWLDAIYEAAQARWPAAPGHA